MLDPTTPPADGIVAGVRDLIPLLACSLTETTASELVEWLLSLHDRLLAAEAELHNLRSDHDLRSRGGSSPL